MRGIAFRDQQKVYTKGSEVGYSLATIEKILAQRQDLKIAYKQEISQSKIQHEKQPENRLPIERENLIPKDNQGMIHELLKPVPETGGGINPSLLEEEKKRKRKHKHRHL